MGKRWRKQKAGSQEPKRRRPRHGYGDTSRAGGTFTGMRRLTRGLVSGGPPKSRLAKAIDLILWLAVGAMAIAVASQQC